MLCLGSQNKNKIKIKKNGRAGCGRLWSERKMGKRAEKRSGEMGPLGTMGVNEKEEKIW